jgi:hypothetical protein
MKNLEELSGKRRELIVKHQASFKTACDIVGTDHRSTIRRVFKISTQEPIDHIYFMEKMVCNICVSLLSKEITVDEGKLHQMQSDTDIVRLDKKVQKLNSEIEEIKKSISQQVQDARKMPSDDVLVGQCAFKMERNLLIEVGGEWVSDRRVTAKRPEVWIPNRKMDDMHESFCGFPGAHPIQIP